MASPPSFLICDDLDDDLTAAADRRNPNPPPAAPPTPHGLNERLLLHLSRSRPRPNPNPSSDPNTDPRPNADAPPDAGVRKVKLAGRRRLCKLSASKEQGEEEEAEATAAGGCGGGDGDGENIRDILDDLTTLLDSLSVDRPKAKPRPHVAPVPCAIAESEVTVYESAASSLHSSPEEAVKKADEDTYVSYVEVSSPDEATAIRGHGELKPKAAKPSALRGCDGQRKKGERTSDPGEVTATRGKARASSLRDYENEEEEEKENSVVVENDGEGVDWERMEDFKMAPTGISTNLKPYKLPGRIFNMLYSHQREGLRWLWVLHCRGTGGILGDDMGLGKTMQVSAFLTGLFHSRLIKRALIVAPKTLLAHWIKELSVVGLKEKIRDYSGASANVRNYELQYTFKEGGVLLTTYDIVRNNYKAIRGNHYCSADDDEEGTLWDYVILDEGHIIKNPKTQRAQSLFEIPCPHRIVISGTPIQNNLKEMWALFYFCCPEVLGDKDEFKVRYENAILRGNDKNASNRDKHIGSNVAKELRERIKPYFLRRLKSEVFSDNGAAEEKKLAKKNELIIWLKLTSCQRQLYEAFLNSELVHSSMQGSPLAAITILKKICDHPLLLTKRAAEGVLEGMDAMLNNQEMGMVEKMAMSLADMGHDDDALQVGEEVSCKISFILSLLRNLVEEGHNVLIFSQTRKMLNLIQEAIILEGYKFLRIDGTTKISEREKIVKDFQEGPGAPIFLLTSQVGGLGLTLTKAARVIVVDPAWNPSTDNQSVDRAYRIGQTKDVIVYRLMTCGTIEEKIYKMQVFKGALFKTATEQKEQTRYFSKRDIQELFSLPPQGFDVSLTQQQLQEEHGQQLVMDESLRKHIKFLEQQGIAGVSHHSLLFSKTATLPTLSEQDALESKPRDVMVKRYYQGASSDYVANGAAYALKPKDERFAARTYSPSSMDAESPEEIKAKINRLSQTLANTALVSRLPDGGEKIRRHIIELDQKLTLIESSPEKSSDKDSEVICLDDLTEDMQNILSV